MCAFRMRVGRVEHVSEISQSSRRTTVESNMKSEHINIYTWLVKTLHDVLSSFSLTLFSSCTLSFHCSLT